MKAIRVHQAGEPDVLKIEEMPDPQPADGQVLVRLRAAGVNPVETYMRSGRYPMKAALPYTPGSDGAGVIEAVGAQVARWKVGDRVYTASTLTGSYAQLALCDAKTIHRLPDNITFAQGAALGVPYATAHRALFHRANAKPGEVVLVHGASGGVGTAATQFARAAGMVVIGTAGTEAGLQLVKDNGAHHALSHRDSTYLQKIMTLTDGRGVDVILEMLANENLAKDLTVLAKFGRVIVIGNRGEVTVNPRDTMGNDADIRGMTLFNASANDLSSIHSAIVAGLENGTLRPIVGKEFSLAEAPQAHRAVLEPGSHGKIVLIP